MSAPPGRAASPFAERVAQAQADDGGWGARAGLASNTEATAFGLLALHAADPADSAGAVRRAAAWLIERQREDGAWSFTGAVPEPSWAGSLAVLALGRAGGHDDAVQHGADWLLGQEGAGFPLGIWLRYKLFPERQAVELNPSFRGWPWVTDTFGWVEPTSWALLALKSLRGRSGGREAERRIRDAERMILDRACAGGGWNYGNSRVLDEELEPFPDTTALALLALQDRPRGEAVRLGLAALDRMLEHNESGLTLSLAILCRRAYGLDAAPLAERLLRAYDATEFLGDARSLALAAIAVAPSHMLDVRSHA